METALFVIGIVVGVIANRILAPYLAEYAKTKGKNLADKEDVRHITQLVESVKQDNQVLLEQVKLRGQLRLAAAEKRLEIHQEAFVMWRGLLQVVHTAQVREVVRTCQTWWEHNCLFLTAEARGAFMRAYQAAADHQMILDGPRNDETARLARENWNTIMRAGLDIVEGVNLPAMGEAEAATV
jgi:hypothetical protein